ncbi:copper amine oxidase N-terminal domain-containing protein [Fenollaria massiliensis]|uniref:Copper amine oxidase N-terminal domain-containing protein n=1 Tax=Fenollaria massiliensis TaxID=938288 RepID=A0A9E7DKL9_9FIRM|nr:copper amine oxidase N-terminal domain-containing protein [Fenollaria massiliensis]UQK59700.1 copper amine oxidase N-terminal domain-containing protein [Fenollaria massiliensis]
MKKLLLIVLSALMFFMSFNSYAKNIDESKINKISGLVNSDFEDKVLEIQGAKKDAAKALFIPAREVFTKLNFDIYWNGEDKSCYFKKGIKNIKVKLGSKNYITSNNNKIELDYAPVLVDMKMYLPIDVLYYLLDYDTFVVADTIYIRNAIDGIKTGIVNEAKYSLAYPVFFSTEDVKRAYRNNINEQIKKFVDEHVEKAKNDANLKKMYFTYDIARSDERLVSLCFYINSVYNDDSTNSEFYTKTFNFNSAEEIKYEDLIKKDQNVRETILEDLTKTEEEKNSIRNNIKNYYIVDNSIILYYYKDTIGSSNIGSHYVRSEDLKFYINEEYLKYFN